MARDRRLALRAIGLCLGAIAVLWARIAISSETPERSVVDTAIAASNPEADALVGALGDVVRHLKLRLRTERRQEPQSDPSWPKDVVARIWIDARAPDRVDIRMTSVRGGASGRTYERSLAREKSTAVVAEDVAQVVRAALESILASEVEEPAPEIIERPRVPASAAELSAVVPPAPPAPGRPPTFGLDALAYGSEQAMSSRSGPIPGAGAAISILAGQVPLRPSLWISAAYDPHFEVQNGPATFDVSTTSFRLMPNIELIELGEMQVDLGAGGGVDLFQVAPLIVRSSMAVFDRSTTMVDPILSGQLLMRLRVAAQVYMVFGFVLDYDLAPHAAAPEGHPGAPHDSFQPWQLRPAATLGFCFPLSSGGACGKPR